VADVKNNLGVVIVAVCGTLVVLAFIAGYTVLGATGRDSAELSRFVNTLLNAAGLVFSGVGGIAGIAGFLKARQAAEQTNGGLDERIVAGARVALAEQRTADVAPGGELRRE
jgi:hypothetical protein